MALKFDARHGLTVANGSVDVIDGNGKIVSSFSSLVVGSIPYQSAAGVTSFLADVAVGNVLLSGGIGAAPAYGKVDLTTHITGVLPVLNGGTGVTTSTGTGSVVLNTSPTLLGTTLLSGGVVAVNTPMMNIQQTWNSVGTAFNGIVMTITDNGSAASSKMIDLQIGSNRFSVDKQGSIVQILAAPNIARDVVGLGGSRHVREYQDLTDDGVQGLLGAPGISTHSYEWGFTWNAKWDTTTSTYLKDRALAGDHSFMFRTSKKYNQEWWFSDGTTAASAISWVNRITFDLPASTYTFNGTVVATNCNVTNLFTAGVTTTNDLIVNGNFTVNGTVTTINTTQISVDDINITLGDVITPTDTTANGGGITLRGTTDKIIAWNQGTTAWDSNQHWNLAVGKTYRINGAEVINATGLGPTIVASSLTSVGIISTGTWNADVISVLKGGTGVTTSTGTGSNVLSANPTLTGTVSVGGASITSGLIQAVGFSTSWGVTNGVTTGAVNAVMGTTGSATWLLSGTSGGVFRYGIQGLDGGNDLRLYAGTGFLQFVGTTGTLTATAFSGAGTLLTALNGTNIASGTVADARIAAALTGKTYNGLSLTSGTIGFAITGGITPKSLTVSNTLILAGTDGSTLNIGTGGTLGTGAFATIANYALLASPALSGVPTAPTAAVLTNTTQVATTAFVQQKLSNNPVMSLVRGTSQTLTTGVWNTINFLPVNNGGASTVAANNGCTQDVTTGGIIVPETGLYRITGSVTVIHTVASTSGVSILLNGFLSIYGGGTSATASYWTTERVDYIVNIAAGTRIDLGCLNDGAANTVAYTTLSGGCQLKAERIA